MHNVKSFLRADFARREDGSVAIETVIILPVLFWAFLSMFSIFDAYRMYAKNQKAAYTVGDMVTRETQPIDAAYVDGAHDLFDYLTRPGQNSSIRISQVYYDKQAVKFKTDWSVTRGTPTALTNDDIGSWNTRLPKVLDGERLVVVETWSDFDPVFATGLEDRVISNFVFTRPRYAPQVLYAEAS
ncbi:hypothetical protein K3756_06000 [Sulfitobacter sp. S190]|nr:hypothetical protein K3756_06000 [Sulfitobacter sp. S190]